MSMTSRGAERAENDHYETPGFAVRALFPMIQGCVASTARILEPGCGTGAIGRELRKKWPKSTIIGVEKSRFMIDGKAPYTKHFEAIDYLGDERPWRTGAPPNIAIANPPFRDLLAFVLRMREDVDMAEGGVVAVLTRVNWLAGARVREPARKALLVRAPPGVGILERRPSFGLNQDGKPGSDGTEYAWLVWGVPHLAGKWSILDCEMAERPRSVAPPKAKSGKKVAA